MRWFLWAVAVWMTLKVFGRVLVLAEGRTVSNTRAYVIATVVESVIWWWSLTLLFQSGY